MPRVTALFVHKVISEVDPSLDRPGLLRRVGVDPDASVDPSAMVEADDYYAFLEAIAAQDPHALDLPLRVGASMRLDEYGALGLAMKSALTLRGSWDRAARYAKVLTSVTTYEVREAKRGAWLVLHRNGERRLGLRLSNEASLAAHLAIARQVSTQEPRLLEVTFEHDAPVRTDTHARHFGCPVHFGAADDAILLEQESLDAPNRLGDPGLASFFETHLERELDKLDEDHSLERRVHLQVSQALSEGVPTVSDIAKQLGMSGRTLQRRLAASGHSFQKLIDEARRQLAGRLLRETEYSLHEVAFLTGFSDQSAFTRAFKRWAGQPPRSYRLARPGR
ncbi:MAG: AraC family transcriptional regulator [Sandaracinaceae bacterium]